MSIISFQNHVVGLAYIVLWTICLFGNGCVIYIFMKTKSLRTPTNMFIVNLAVSDLCMMTTQGPPVTFNAFVQRYWMFGEIGCKVYALTGGVFGTISILSMVVIGYDRYNVICKGFSGVKITPTKAVGIILCLWLYSTAVCVPPFFGWGGYAAEGTLITCSYDYLTQDWNHRSFMLYAFIFNYCVPMIMVISFYTQIVKAVVKHESALKAQAKKMNVDSLRSGEQQGDSAEIKIYLLLDQESSKGIQLRVAITNVMLWICIWSPYAIVVMTGCFGNMNLITPMVAALPSFLAKTASCLNPLVYAISHPKYREALSKEIPCLGIGPKLKGTVSNSKA
ncbi:compound eye opsin BCRH2 [Eurytemora carolleeae]|uniref:compound eye opsin BCRH2 n=1 Tax=Eurytemora carolleeae TaxID=1294199 RepID=UPI000C75F62B|nr:compound eye opsin BCRH2 [Eurytemora carolleeae]|eukprot:XP_023334314.1 compound eye opsin BCRH2-like [Eurytemora affinis]